MYNAMVPGTSKILMWRVTELKKMNTELNFKHCIYHTSPTQTGKSLSSC